MFSKNSYLCDHYIPLVLLASRNCSSAFVSPPTATMRCTPLLYQGGLRSSNISSTTFTRRSNDCFLLLISTINFRILTTVFCSRGDLTFTKITLNLNKPVAYDLPDKLIFKRAISSLCCINVCRSPIISADSINIHCGGA